MTPWRVLPGLAPAVLAAACAAVPDGAPVGEMPPVQARPAAKAPAPPAPDCRAEVGRLQARLVSEVAERQRLLKAASRREDALKRQLEALKSIERGILDREDRVQPDHRTETTR